MEEYKDSFIDFLLDNKALLFGEFILKSGRSAPYFINTGVFDNGISIQRLGEYYADIIIENFMSTDYDIIHGPAYKGIPLAVSTAIALFSKYALPKGYTFDRKKIKSHGEGTQEEIQKNCLVGHKIKDGDGIILLDDVFTTGRTKYETLELLGKCADNLRFPGLIIAVDRQEVGIDGTSAIEEFEKKTKIPVKSIVTVSEIFDHLSGTDKITDENRRSMKDYLKNYGIEKVKKRG